MANILVVDDEPEIREVIRFILESDGHQVTEAEDGIRGTSIIGKGYRPDLIITDIFMPNMDGIEFINNIRNQFPDMKIIAMSAGSKSNRPDYLGIAKKLGAGSTVNKPFRTSQLKVLVDAKLGYQVLSDCHNTFRNS